MLLVLHHWKLQRQRNAHLQPRNVERVICQLRRRERLLRRISGSQPLCALRQLPRILWSASLIPMPASTSTPSRCRTNRTGHNLSVLRVGSGTDGHLGGRQRIHDHLGCLITEVHHAGIAELQPRSGRYSARGPKCGGPISIIGGHLYGVQPTAYSIPSGDTPKELWMTEYGPGSTATPTFAQVLTTYGESIHDAMVNGQYNAYVWWGVFGASTGANGGGTNACSYGLVDNAGNQTVAGWVSASTRSSSSPAMYARRRPQPRSRVSTFRPIREP